MSRDNNLVLAAFADAAAAWLGSALNSFLIRIYWTYISICAVP
jgi:hypothetical protein